MVFVCFGVSPLNVLGCPSFGAPPRPPRCHHRLRGKATGARAGQCWSGAGQALRADGDGAEPVGGTGEVGVASLFGGEDIDEHDI